MATFKGKTKLHNVRPGGRSQESKNKAAGEGFTQAMRRELHEADKLTRAKRRDDRQRTVHRVIGR